MTTLEDIDVITATAAELEERLHRTIPCEGTMHNVGVLGHDPEQAAGYRVTSPCCRRVFHACDSRVLWWHSEGLVGCGRCGIQHLVESYTFVPIGDN